MKDIIRKGDIILLIVLLLLGAALSWLSVRGRVTGTTAVVRVNGKEYGTYSLAQDRTIRIRRGDRKNVIVIRGGEVSMRSSTCKNQICVRHDPISNQNESIVCLPNRVSIEIKGDGDGDVDTIAG